MYFRLFHNHCRCECHRRVGSSRRGLLAFDQIITTSCPVRHLQRRARSLYDVLGVSRDSTAKEIKAKYLELAKKYHPDAVASQTVAERESVTKKFQEIQQAYQVLSKESDRKTYDATGSTGPRSGQAYSSSYNPYAREYRNPTTDQPSYQFWASSRRRKSWDQSDSFNEWINEQNRRRWEHEKSQWKAGNRDPFSSDRYDINFQPSKSIVVKICFAIIFFGITLNFLAALESQSRIKEMDDLAKRHLARQSQRIEANRVKMATDREQYFKDLEASRQDYDRFKGNTGVDTVDK